jgi:hypothetical protein
MTTKTLPTVVALLAAAIPAVGQPPPVEVKVAKPPPDEFKSLVSEVTEAYKAPYEVDEDIRDELRGAYKKGLTPQKEDKLIYEVRRLYQTTPEQEEVIRREIRRAHELQTSEQEERMFAEIRRLGTIPPGTVPPVLQAEASARMFRRLDRDGNGVLGPDEMPEVLFGDRQRWDANRDGSIDAEEYRGYFQAGLKSVSERVASGEIPIKLPKGVPGPTAAKPTEERPVAVRPGKLPPGLPKWFAEYDQDGDGQVGLYEWRRMGKPIKEFVPMDRNEDGYLTPKEVLDHQAEQAKANPPPTSPKK